MNRHTKSRLSGLTRFSELFLSPRFLLCRLGPALLLSVAAARVRRVLRVRQAQRVQQAVRVLQDRQVRRAVSGPRVLRDPKV